MIAENAGIASDSNETRLCRTLKSAEAGFDQRDASPA